MGLSDSAAMKDYAFSSTFLLWLLFLILERCSCLSPPSMPSPGKSDKTGRQTCFPKSISADQSDLDVMTRQTGQSGPSQAAMGIPSACQCQHGFPQVFTMDPLPNGKRLNSGLVKLTCPLLVRAVDELEDEGYITQFNDKLCCPTDRGADEKLPSDLQIAISKAHRVHSSVRSQLIDSREDRDRVLAKLGKRGFESFMTAGVAGASPNALNDVKCLHAWLGDYLFRGPEDSPVGDMVVQVLLERGVEVSGNADCKSYCDPKSNLLPEPPIPRNKQRKRSSKELARRRRAKEPGEDR